MNSVDKFALFIYLIFSALTGFILVDGIVYHKFVTSFAGLILFAVSQLYYIAYGLLSNQPRACRN